MGKRISIDDMLIARIIWLPYQGRDPSEEFVGKYQDKEIARAMKEKFELVKGKQGYDINSIKDQVHFFAQQ